MAALDWFLRRELLPRLPARAVVVAAGRRPPLPWWFQHGWETVTLELPLGPFDPAESDELLGVLGVTDPGVARQMASWAAGSPLALSIAAAGPAAGRFPADRPHVTSALARRLLDAEPDGWRLGVLAVAAIARTVTPALLRAVLPERDAADRSAGCRSARSPSRSAPASRCTTWCAARSAPSCATESRSARRSCAGAWSITSTPGRSRASWC